MVPLSLSFSCFSKISLTYYLLHFIQVNTLNFSFWMQTDGFYMIKYLLLCSVRVQIEASML